MSRAPLPAAFLLLAAVASAASGQVSPAHEEPPAGGGIYAGDFASDPAALAALSALSGPASCTEGLAAAQFACANVDLEGFLSLNALVPGATSGSNLWGFVDLDDGREYAVMGVSNGTSIVEVTDPAHPRVVGSVRGPESIWREVKVYQVWNPSRGRHDAYAYVVSEASRAGLQILDLSDLPASVSLAATFRGFDTAHTVFLANADPGTGAPNVPDVEPVLYVEGSNEGFLALDISTPTAPTITGRFRDSYVHDIWAGVFRGERAGPCAAGHDRCEVVADFGGNAIRLIDFTDKSDPVILSAISYDELGYAHSGWISRDGRYLFAFDEGDEILRGGKSRIRIVDVSDLAHPFVAAIWTSSTDAIEHNGYVVGDRLYVSYYERGLAILDVTEPTSPREIGFFDTFPAGDEAQFHGAWGVYPYLPSGTLLVSSIDGAGGLFVLRESVSALAPPPDIPRGPVVPVAPGLRGTRRLPGSR